MNANTRFQHTYSHNEDSMRPIPYTIFVWLEEGKFKDGPEKRNLIHVLKINSFIHIIIHMKASYYFKTRRVDFSWCPLPPLYSRSDIIIESQSRFGPLTAIQRIRT